MKDDVIPAFRAAGASNINKKNKKLMTQDRRNDYDVTNTVQVSNPVAVRDAVNELVLRDLSRSVIRQVVAGIL